MRPLIERPSHADTSAVECSNAGVNAHTNSNVDLYTIAARADRRSLTIPSLRRSDGRTPARASRALNARSRIERMPDPTGPDHARSRASTPVTHRVGAVDSPAERERQPDRSAWKSDPGAKAARVKGADLLPVGRSASHCDGLVNLSDAPAQARVRLPWADLAEGTWKLTERLTGRRVRRAGRRRKGGRGPVRGPRPLGIELAGARALTPSSASRRAGPRRSAAPCGPGERGRFLCVAQSGKRLVNVRGRRRRGRVGSAAPRLRPGRSCSWSGLGVPATGRARRVRQPWRLR